MPDKRRSSTETVLPIDPRSQEVVHTLPLSNPPMARLTASTYTYTGPRGSLTYPGVRFTVDVDEGYRKLLLHPLEQDVWKTVDADGHPMMRISLGVMDRATARRLRNVLTDFLTDFPEEESL